MVLDITANGARIRASASAPSSGPPAGYVSPYLSSAVAATLLVPSADGMPPLHFVSRDGAVWLAEDSTGKLVNVATRQLRALGIWSCRVRGDQHAPGTLRLGPVQLVREPNNPHDRNAVAIHQNGVHVGYFNKQMASGLAHALDAGTKLEALGVSVDPPKVVAATPATMLYLRRRM
ncbi:HIRAN domain-containing protein [Microbacterium binotii]|uniref:HIRAN domain-containing protein n=1 Tax=Microbacterium binotii TaxID=462710 RepID=UPI001F1967E5|nr:HIRAN domain-containing protein [Microbacterium binotii]UIN30933.1 HIRAN domain-containing protein [Microbacterium binotii]